MNRSFWNGRRVFLTGHTGFKGTWTLGMLAELGADVTGFALPPPTDPAIFDLVGGAKLCRDLRGDIRDRQAVEAAFAEARPEIVIHMAAQSLVRASYVDPVGTYETNVMGTVNILEACRNAPDVRSALIVTTDKCYENLGWDWGYRENDRLGGADPYSNSKAACELVVEAYRHSFFSARRGVGAALNIGSARAGNVIGGGDFAHDRLIPDAMRAFSADQSLSIRNPMAVRPWQHVLDPVFGYLLLAERLTGSDAFAQGWNFGPSVEENASVRTVVDLVIKQWQRGANWVQDPHDHPHEAATLKLDSTKAWVKLGWKGLLGLSEAVSDTVDWYRAYFDGDDVAQLTFRQVRNYLDRRIA